jgi:F-type H+-transporting ATPase subunit c
MEVLMMRRKTAVMILSLIITFCAFPLLAADQEKKGSYSEGELATLTKFIAAGAMAIATCFCALFQARVAISAFEGISRNPASADSIRGLFIIGIVMIESLALYTMVIIFLKV